MTRHPDAPQPKTLDPDLINAFATIVGPKHAVTDPNEISPYLTEERGLYHGHAPLLLRPATTGDVSEICALANQHRIALVPQGGNTGLVGGQTPHHGEVIVSMRRMDRIRDIDSESATMTCEAGVVLANAQMRAAQNGHLFPLSLAAEGSCTIGGNISTNAGGTSALAYGVARDLVMGLEVVLADGRVWNGLSKLKKDNTGYDLKNLFIGAEGTLGIITAATLKLWPRPNFRETAFVAIASPQAALSLLTLAREKAAHELTSFELISNIAHDMAVQHGPNVRAPLNSHADWFVLLELSSSRAGLRETLENLLASMLEKGIIQDAALAASLDQRAAFWRLRECISQVQKFEGGSIKHDVSVPVAAVPDFIEQATHAALALVPGCRPCPFGHLGDGNIHFNVSQPIGADKEAFLARWPEMNAAVHGVVTQLGGSISAEHGIGILKRDLLPGVKDKVALEMMRALKQTFDPNNIMNPGKVLPER